jgi:acyl-CoA hydrolase
MPARTVLAAESCQAIYLVPDAPAKSYREDYDRLDVTKITKSKTAQETMTQMIRFGREHNLPFQLIEVGPPERRLHRLFVAVDGNDPALMQAYRDQFNLNQKLGADVDGSLVLEFAYEKAKSDQYVTGVLRTSSSPLDPIYRWGRKDLVWNTWWRDWLTGVRRVTKDPVLGYGHVIGLSAPERENVQYFLEHPNERGPCKSDNCVAWTSSIELGRTRIGVEDDERKHLFTELGVARASAHFEILRRLVHAANDRHATIAIFVEGQEGYRWFEKGVDLLPEDPKIPYQSIIRGLDFKETSPIMQAISQIPDGAKVFIPIAAGASPDGVSALIQKSVTAVRGYDVHVQVNGVSASTLQKAVQTAEGKFRLHALFLGGNLRKLYREGKVNVIPGYLSDFARMVQDPVNEDFRYDAMIVRVAPADAEGHYSLGPNNDMIMTVLRNRPGIKVIAEINPNIPRTAGENFLTKDQITASFESGTQLAGPPRVPKTEVETAIGANVASLIDPQATLQIGIGNVFDGIPDALLTSIPVESRGQLKISTEMFGDNLKTLIENGAASSGQTGFAYGSPGLYQWLNNNKKVTFLETDQVNNPSYIAAIPKMHAINTALQVTLLGATNATHGPDGVRISSPGGQVEFMSGAARSPGGKAIIAIRSTAKNGQLSTIVLDTYGGHVTTPYESVTHVVTEYGVAKLVGKSERERAIQMINIAHPKFRQELVTEALQRGLIQPADVIKIHIDIQ